MIKAKYYIIVKYILNYIFKLYTVYLFLEMKIDDNANSNNNIKEEREIRPLSEIIEKYLSQFKIEEAINIFFSLKENDKKSNKNKKINYEKSLSRIEKNTKFQLQIFVEVLRENYDDQCIIKELYKYLFINAQKNSLMFEEENNDKENSQNEEFKKEESDNHIKKLEEKDYIFILNKGKIKKKKLLENVIQIDNNWIIPSNSSYFDFLLNKNKIRKNIIGYLYKDNSNNIFFYNPIIEQNNLIKNENLKKIIENKNKLLFVCELFLNENKNNRCNSYGIYDLNTMDFKLGAPHSKDNDDHPHSLKTKYKDNGIIIDEIMEVIFYLSNMEKNGALIFNDNL